MGASAPPPAAAPMVQAKASSSVEQQQAEHAAAYLNFLAALPPLATARAASTSSASCGSAVDDALAGRAAPSPPGPPLLGPQPPHLAGRPTLVLDLDHTLVRSVALRTSSGAAASTSAIAAAARPGRVVLPRPPGADPAAPLTAFDARPGLGPFLAAAASRFEVVVFTAGARAYADPVLDALDPAGTLFAARLYREACIRVAPAPAARARLASSASSAPASSSSFRPPPPGGAWLMKDLAALGRPLARTVLVDNTPTVFGYQPANGIPIPSWHGVPGGDTSLGDLLPLLEACASAPDVRPVIAAAFPATLGVVLAAVAAFPSMFSCAPAVLAPAEAVGGGAPAPAPSTRRSASPTASSAGSAATAAASLAAALAPQPPAAPRRKADDEEAANNALAAAVARSARPPRPPSAAAKRPRSAHLPTPARSAPKRRARLDSAGSGGRDTADAPTPLSPRSTAVCA